MNEIRVDMQLVLNELKAMLLASQYQLAIAGARLIQQAKEIESLQQSLIEVTKKIPQE